MIISQLELGSPVTRLVNSAQISHQTTRAQSEKTIWGFEIILRTIMIKKRQGLFHNSANNRERWSRKAIAWRSVSCKMISSRIRQKNTLNCQSVFCTYSVVCSLHFVLGLQSAVCILYWLVFVGASLKSGPKYWSSKNWCVDCILKSSRGKAQW